MKQTINQICSLVITTLVLGSSTRTLTGWFPAAQYHHDTTIIIMCKVTSQHSVERGPQQYRTHY